LHEPFAQYLEVAGASGKAVGIDSIRQKLRRITGFGDGPPNRFRLGMATVDLLDSVPRFEVSDADAKHQWAVSAVTDGESIAVPYVAESPNEGVAVFLDPVTVLYSDSRWSISVVDDPKTRLVELDTSDGAWRIATTLPVGTHEVVLRLQRASAVADFVVPIQVVAD
jgi:hypothetical protein